MKLAIAQIVFGVLIVVNHFLMLWALGVLSLSWDWGVWFFLLQPVLGLSVLGCGIVQLLKARSQSG